MKSNQVKHEHLWEKIYLSKATNKISKLINEIPSDKVLPEQPIELNNDETNIFIKPLVIDNNLNNNIYNKTILTKKKMDELHKICDELNITYHKKIKKNDLINIILNLN